MTNETFTCNARFFAMAAPFASTEATRYYLNGVAIQPRQDGNGCFLITTDGHRLAVFHDSAATAPRDAIMKAPKELIAAAKKAYKISDDARIVFSQGKATVQTPLHDDWLDQAVCLVDEIDGTFPDWKRIVPTIDPEKGVSVVAFNAAYLGSFEFKGLRSKASMENGHKVIDIYAESAESPAIIRLADVPEFMGVLMPCRNHGILEARPEWLDDRPAKDKAA